MLVKQIYIYIQIIISTGYWCKNFKCDHLHLLIALHFVNLVHIFVFIEHPNWIVLYFVHIPA